LLGFGEAGSAIARGLCVEGGWRGIAKPGDNAPRRLIAIDTALDKDAQSWAKKNKVTIGAPPQDDAHQAETQQMQDLKQRLESLSGTEFDKTYMQAMAEDHAKDLNTVQTFQQQTTNKSLKKLLDKAQKVIASHRKEADKLVQKLGATASR